MAKPTWTLSRSFVLKGVLALLLALVTGGILYGFVALGELRVVLPKVAEMTGLFRGEKRYLLLLQNNAELRPTGGFITAYGELTFTWGVPTGLSIADVYSLKGHDDEKMEEAPYPMGDMLKGPNYKGYSFHDANWHADVPTSAADILRFYDAEFPGRRIDGVVFVNYAVVEHLVKLVGALPYQGKILSSEELFHTIEFEQNNIDRHNVADLENRKSILATLMPELSRALLRDPGKFPAISALLTQELQNKNIALWMADKDLQQYFSDLGWTNLFPSPALGQDLVAVVFANLGGMKSDRYIEKEIAHDVELQRTNDSTNALRLVVTDTVTLRHLGDYNAPLSHVYRGFARSYIPKEAKLIDVDPAAFDIYEEMGYMVVGKKLTVEPKKATSYSYAYELPASFLMNDTWRTYLYKQSGEEHLTTRTSLRVPQDQLITSSMMDVRENVATFVGRNLPGDLTFTAHIGKDTTPPRVSFQEFVDYNRITVQFNEPVLKVDCEDMENYSVLDTNTKVPDITNVPTILKVTCKDREATIQTRNIRSQYGEHFELRLRNIRDWSNNIISPNPRTITIVQRFDQDKPAEATPPSNN
ncbi:hypothetical protein COW46_02830 [Candidatus Gracilibacteria bacterium CG17_big_fil_post_rev_8_21_14_2_50_48_13]|nr:MAG: hypothetical protein COW46_02830 [Candidatus Gracilibacteria bacterium CG17_big_fil_post_rev_8_21_14_2_50_48_13]